jgi:hypothetical protein
MEDIGRGLFYGCQHSTERPEENHKMPHSVQTF